MRRFHFSLGRVLEWRRLAAEVEENRLARLLGERSAIELEARRLLEARTEAERAVLPRRGPVAAVELAALDAFRRHTTAARGVLARRRADCERRIAEQRAKVLEARRAAELLERLKRRHYAAWQAAAARAEQVEADEISLARRAGRHGNG